MMEEINKIKLLTTQQNYDVTANDQSYMATTSTIWSVLYAINTIWYKQDGDAVSGRRLSRA